MASPATRPRLLILTELVRDERWHPRQKLRPSYISELATLYRDGGPDALPPILTGHIPTVEGLLLVDGWHRAAAAEQAGLTELPAIVNDYADRWQAYAEAVRLANTGPQSLTPGEKGRNIDAFLLQFPDIGPGELAQRLGVTRQYVWKRQSRLNEEPAASDPVARDARALLKALVHLWEADPPERAPGPEEQLNALARELAAAARKCQGDEAGLWLQRLEEAAHAAWRVIAADPAAAAAARAGRKAA
jgi:ParB-like chromosome segregation protein Spo0J